MPTTTLAVASEVSKGANWSYVGGAADYTNLQSDDSDTTRMDSNDNNGDSRFTLDNLPGEAGIIVSVTARHKSKKTNTNNPTLRLRLTDSGGTQDGSGVALSEATYTEKTEAFATAAGATPWSVLLVNGLDVHLEKTAGGVNSGHSTTLLNVDVAWLPGPAGYQALLASLAPWLLPLIGSSLLLRDVTRLLRHTRHVFSIAEQRALLNELQAWRRPVLVG